MNSSVHGILQARILEWVAVSSPGPHPPGIGTTCLLHPEIVLSGLLEIQFRSHSVFSFVFLGEPFFQFY